ncbi:MAG: hypothetical protein LBJ10_02090 [Clostridiales bacterium]|jgi:hypothetical protein|nr:hypothetical protein [Clostridiales bacterium]
MMHFIQKLNADEASQVLKDLLGDSPELTKKTYEIALKVAGDVDADDIADDVFSELDRLDMDDLNARSGRTRYGYVEPYDAAWELFEEALNPFIDEMKKNQRRALPAAAKNYCIGIIKGLQRYDEGATSDISDWIPDAPSESIGTVIEEWKKGSASDNDTADIMRVAKGGNNE